MTKQQNQNSKHVTKGTIPDLSYSIAAISNIFANKNKTKNK